MNKFLTWLRVGVLTLLTATAASAQTAVQFAQTSKSGTITANSQSIALSIGAGRGYGTASVQLIGTFTGTIQVQCSTDLTNYVAVIVGPIDNTTTSTDVTSPGIYSGNIAGCKAVRARSTSWSSGTASVTLTGYSSGGGSGGGASGAVTVTSGTITCTNCSGTGVAVNEDVASNNADPGTPAYSVRNDTVTGATSTSGDYQPLKSDAAGSLWVNGASGTFPATQSGPWNVTNVSGTVSLPTGASTSANQTTEITSLQLIDDAVSGAGFNITQLGGAAIPMTTTQADNLALTLDGLNTTSFTYVYDGTNMDLLRVGTAGTAAAQVLTIQGIASATPVIVSDGAGAMNIICDSGCSGGTQYTEDIGSAGGETVTLAGVIRQDTPASSTSSDGDYTTLKSDSVGRLWINCATGCSGGTQYTEDNASAGAESLFLIGGVRRDTTPSSSSGTAGDYSNFILDGNGRLFVQAVLYNSSGAELTPSQDQTLDAAIGTTGPMMIGRGSTATPTAMSADGDATAMWLDLNGRVHLIDEGIEDAPETAAGFLGMVGTVRRDTAASSAGTTGDNATLNTDSIGRLWVSGAYPEDAIHTSADIGIQVLTKRTDAIATSANADGDYATLNTDASGRLWVNCSTGCSGGTQFAEDLGATNADVGTIALVVRQDTPASSTTTDGDYTTLKSDSIGRLWINCATGCSGGTQYVEDVGSAGAETMTLAGVVRQDTLASSTTTDGDYAYMKTNANGALWVADINSAALLTSNQLQDDVVYTTDAAAGASPIGAMTLCRASAATPTAISADNDAQATWCDTNGRIQVNVAQIAGNVPAFNAGNVGATVQRVTLATDQAAMVGLGVYVEDAAETAGGNLVMSGAVRRDTAASSSGNSGDNSTINVDATGLLWGRHLDPCSGNAKTTDPFSLTARGVIIAAAASKKNYICSISVVAGAAEIFNVVEGTGTTCQTGTAAIAGSTTAANGLSFAANGGLAAIGGDAAVMSGKTANVDTCIMPSGSNRLSGFVTYVQQ